MEDFTISNEFNNTVIAMKEFAFTTVSVTDGENVSNGTDVIQTEATINSVTDEYWASKYTRISNLVCPPVIMGFGIVGNILSFLVMSRRRMRRTSIGIYCMALAISDSLVCNSIYPNYIHNALKHKNLYKGLMYNLYLFITYASGHISAWLIVAITIDRFISVGFPIHAKAWCTGSRATKVVLSIVSLFLLLDGIHFFGLLKGEVFTDEAHMYVGRTDGMTSYLNSAWHLIDATMINFIPSPVVMTFNMIIIFKLRRFLRQRSTLVEQPTGGPADPGGKLYLMLISVTMVFATITVPYYTWTIYTGYLETWKTQDAEEGARRAFILYVFIHLYCINHSINFYIYCITGQKFRDELRLLFRESCYRFRIKFRKSGNEDDQITRRATPTVSSTVATYM